MAASQIRLFIYLFFAATALFPDKRDSHLLFSEESLLNIAGMVSGLVTSRDPKLGNSKCLASDPRVFSRLPFNSG